MCVRWRRRPRSPLTAPERIRFALIHVPAPYNGANTDNVYV